MAVDRGPAATGGITSEQAQGTDPPSQATIGIPIPPEVLGLLLGMGPPPGFGQGPHHVFSAIKDASSQHPGLADLAAYGEEVAAKIATIESEPELLGPHQIEQLIDFGPELAALGFRSVVKRLRAETDYLKELEDSGIAEALAGDLREGRYGARVKFIPKDSLRWKFSNHPRGTKGAYNQVTDTCLIVDDDCPTPTEMWVKLTESGTLPDIVSVLDHELTHDMQMSRGKRTKVLLVMGLQAGYVGTIAVASGPFALFSGVGAHTLSKAAFGRWANSILPDRMLSEIHAFEAAAAAPSFSDPNLDEKHEILTNLMLGYGFGPGSARLLSHAFDLVHSLRLLGLGDREIGRLVGDAKTNEEQTCFPLLEERITAERTKLGLEDDQAYSLFMRGAGLRHELEIEYQRTLARQIAVEEVKKFLVQASTTH